MSIVWIAMKIIINTINNFFLQFCQHAPIPFQTTIQTTQEMKGYGHQIPHLSLNQITHALEDWWQVCHTGTPFKQDPSEWFITC